MRNVSNKSYKENNLLCEMTFFPEIMFMNDVGNKVEQGRPQ
jgi:hypothetical protein